MIIYYNNLTGKVYGAIMGRVHNEFKLKPNLIQPKGVEKKYVSRSILDLEKTLEIEEYLGKNKFKVLDCEVVPDEKGELFLRKKLSGAV